MLCPSPTHTTKSKGIWSADKAAIKPGPLIAQSSWLKHVVVRAGELIPLVDLAMVLSPVSGAADDKPVWQRYAADSGFPALFARYDVEVVEFSLLGVCHALPKVEVQDVIAFKPCRALPDVVPIVIGVAEHNGEILPVVDLAMMFGRRSLATPAWRMMLVNNGDFRALVVTEAVFGERSLPLDIHRTVPIHLPHNLMYGCYPDANAVRIILNVAAITVHFEKSLIQIFMPALSQEMRMSPTGVVYTFPEEKVVPMEIAGPIEKVREEPQPLASVAPVRAEAEPVPEAAPAAEVSPAAPEPEQQAEEEDAGFVEWEEADTVASTIVIEEETQPEPADILRDAASSASTQEPRTTADERSADAAFEQGYVQELPEKTIAPETMTAAAQTPEHIAPVQEVPDRESSGEGNKAREPARNKKSPLEVLKASAKKKRIKKISATAAADSRPAEPIHAAASARSGEPDHLNRGVEPLAAWAVYEERASGKVWKRSIAYGAVVAVLIAVFYFSGSSDKPVVEISAQGTEPEKIEQALVRPEQPKLETAPVKIKDEPAKEKIEQARMEAEQARLDDEQTKARAKAKAELEARAQAEIELQAKQEADAKRKADAKVKQTLVLSPLTEEQTEPPRPEDKSRAPPELDIPANKPVDIDEYVVQESDTLWSISQRFTGSAYNYPRIAGENRIAEPDLIFPGQRIRLIK